jgi:hypothetical protein
LGSRIGERLLTIERAIVDIVDSDLVVAAPVDPSAEPVDVAVELLSVGELLELLELLSDEELVELLSDAELVELLSDEELLELLPDEELDPVPLLSDELVEPVVPDPLHVT